MFEKHKPTHMWLEAHETFFPHIKAIQGLKFIFGFGIVSSSIADDIKGRGVSEADYVHINVWNPEELTYDMFHYDKEVFDHYCRLLDIQNKRAHVVLSVGRKVFEYFDYRHNKQLIRHLELLPMPEEGFFNLPTIIKPPDNRYFQILTPFEHHAVLELSSHSIVPKAINLVAESYSKVDEEPPKWKILCTQKEDDKDVISCLKPHSKLNIIVHGYTADTLRDELQHTHLLVVPPRSINSLNVVIASIASARPILVPTLSEGDHFIKEYFPEWRDNIVVDMRKGKGALKKMITYIIKHYDEYLKRAAEMKAKMINTVLKQIEKINLKLRDEIRQRLQLSSNQECISESQTIVVSPANAGTTSATSIGLQSTSEHNVSSGYSSSEQTRTNCTISVKVDPSFGNAVNGTSMSGVEDAFHQIERNRPTTEGTGEAIANIHGDLEVEKVEDGCLRYVVKCGSCEALEALWSEYICGQLDKTIHTTIITPTLLSKIQAHYLTLDIYIPVQEYLLCKREIPLIKGLLTIQPRRHSVAAITELQTVKSRDSTHSQTVESLSLILSKMQIRDSKINSDVLGRDDFRIGELHHFGKTFAIKRDKLWLDVLVEESKHGLSKRTRDRLVTDGETDISSFIREHDSAISDFVQLKTDPSLYSCHRKAVLYEVGQKLITQMEFATSQATTLKEKCETTMEVHDEMQRVLDRVNKGYPVKGSVLEVFGYGSKPGQFEEAEGIYIKNNGQCVVCDKDNHRVQVIDPIKLCCDLILQFLALPESFNPWNVTVDEDNDKYFMSDLNNGQVVVSSGQSKILNCFGSKEGIKPTGICLNDDGFLFIGDLNGYVRKYNKSGEHIARTEEGQVSRPWDLIVNKKCIFVSDFGRECVHVLNHQMQSIRDIGKGHLEGPMGLCFDHQQDGIYVCDISGHRVLHFNCDGEFLSCKGQGQLEYPRYIALCKDNPYRLVVTQRYCIKLMYV
ncbi:uncharacterized protein [Ptychodera flava]|uniref:uncharacterized protein isoform X3 n=1 Tax=Ptychodera flava TaxID=63121 RepID=UPI00396A48C6